jgi:hypothetical protein
MSRPTTAAPDMRRSSKHSHDRAFRRRKQQAGWPYASSPVHRTDEADSSGLSSDNLHPNIGADVAQQQSERRFRLNTYNRPCHNVHIHLLKQQPRDVPLLGERRGLPQCL